VGPETAKSSSLWVCDVYVNEVRLYVKVRRIVYSCNNRSDEKFVTCYRSSMIQKVSINRASFVMSPLRKAEPRNHTHVEVCVNVTKHRLFEQCIYMLF
jgi:hypothetical protein